MNTTRIRNFVIFFPFIAAALWAIGGSIYLPTIPFYRGSSSSTSVVSGEEVTVVEEKELTLVEANGRGIYFTLGLFAGLYTAAAVLAVLRRWMAAAVFSRLERRVDKRLTQ